MDSREHYTEIGGWESLVKEISGLPEISAEAIETLCGAVRLRAIRDQLECGMFLVELPSGKILDANAPICRILGYSSERISRMSFDDIMDVRLSRRIQGLFAAYNDNFDKDIHLRGAIIRSDESELSADVQVGVGIFGEKKYGVVVIRDISEVVQSQREKEISESESRKAEKLESVSRLAGVVAHDFNNQLTVIRGYCEMLMSHLRDRPDIANLAQQVLLATERATTLTGRLLSLGRKQNLNPKTLDINSFLEANRGRYLEVLGAGIQIEMILDTDLQKVWLDPTLLEHASLNLVENARDAMPTGGKLIVHTANIDVDVDYIGRHPEASPGPHVLMSVCDTGCGMDKRHLEQIFEPFFTTKPMGQGTGLSLAKMYGFVMQSGGHIIVTSEPDEGTKFEILFPVAAVETEPEGKPTPRLYGNKPETVLVAEDDPAVRMLLVRSLRDYGYNVIEVEDPNEAVPIAEKYQEKIDMFITDVVMPGRPGPELVKIIRKIHPEIKVLYITGHSDNIVADHGADGKEEKLLRKPFGPSVLAGMVREILDASPPSENRLENN